MVEIDREYLRVMMEAGYIYLGMRRFKQARELFDGLIALAPKSEVPFVALGNVDFCEGKIGQAMRRYRQALKIDPSSAFAKVYLGEALLFGGKKREAVDTLSEVAGSDRGGAGEFAKALLDATKKGFEPKISSKVKGER